MLSNDTIKKAVQNNEIEITISFGIEDGTLVLYEAEKRLQESLLSSNLYSDRLKLTMGPIVKILNRGFVRKKYRFKSNKKLYDIRKSHNKYVIKPGESIIILTNERIKLNGKYACLVVPRISLSDVGIVVTTAYVDPFYNGVMRLHLSNLSEKAFELNALEAIAQCFFFELSESVSEEFKEKFSTKSVFFGQTWHGIMSSDRHPFPIKKKSASEEKFSDLKYQWSIIWNFIKKNSLIIVILTNVLVLARGYETFRKQNKKYTETVKQVEEILKPTASEIIITPGEKYGEKEIIIECSKSDIISVICNNDKVRYQILSGDTEKKTKIIFSYSLEESLIDEYELNFSYAIIRRIK